MRSRTVDRKLPSVPSPLSSGSRLSRTTLRLLRLVRRVPLTRPGIELFLATALLSCFAFVAGCHESPHGTEPVIQFTRVPNAGEGGPNRVDTISGRVIGAQPGERIVLYAKWGPWWVQPLVDHPFTDIKTDSNWSSPTHFGTEYAALLVDPTYQPPPTAGALLIQPGIVAIATTKGRPPFWLSWWFVLAAFTLLAFAMSLVLRFRVDSLARQMNMRFEERLAERTRIARDLHDSLLQGFQGLLFRLQAARDLLPACPTDAIKALEAALDRADQVIAEGRNTVEDLRNPMPTNDIAQAVTALGEELNVGEAALRPTFRVLVEGRPRVLYATLRDETYRIAREALRNAFLHSQARQIEAQITYEEVRFLLRVRDDGVGIDPRVFDHGRPGHWGLPGMRERANELGGTLRVWSERGAGTEIELSVPAGIAYQRSSVAPVFSFLRKKHPETYDRLS